MLSASRPRWPWRDFEDIRTSDPSTFRQKIHSENTKRDPTAPSKYLSLQYWWLKCNLIILNLQIQPDWSVQASHSNWLVHTPPMVHEDWETDKSEWIWGFRCFVKTTTALYEPRLKALKTFQNLSKSRSTCYKFLSSKSLKWLRCHNFI